MSFGRRSKRLFLIAAAISIAPDLLAEGLFFVLTVPGVKGMPGGEPGHPNITDYPAFAQALYNATHGLVIFAAVFTLFWIVSQRAIWVVAAWGLHILIDIPTHSLELFTTPFLWPISDVRIDGIGWDDPAVLIIDTGLLIFAYLMWLYPRMRSRLG